MGATSRHGDAASETLGRRERKKQSTHRALRLAALQLGADRGLHHVTVEDIAEMADVSVRTFYDHFSSKEDAVVGLDPARVELLRTALTERPESEPPMVALHAALATFACALVDESDEWPLRMQIVEADPTLRPRLLAALATYEQTILEAIAIRTGTDPEGDLYPALVAATATSAFRTVVSFWKKSNGAIPLVEQLDLAFRLLESGLCPLSGTDQNHTEQAFERPVGSHDADRSPREETS